MVPLEVLVDVLVLIVAVVVFVGRLLGHELRMLSELVHLLSDSAEFVVHGVFDGFGMLLERYNVLVILMLLLEILLHLNFLLKIVIMDLLLLERRRFRLYRLSF